MKIDGGISANRFVAQSLSDLLNIKITNIGIADVSALGAAMIAGVGSNIFTSIEELGAMDQQQHTYHPVSEREDLLGAYQGWKTEIENL